MRPEFYPASSTDQTSFAVQLPAAPEHLGTSRHQLAQWLGDIQMPRTRFHDILLAVGEAVTNAIEHGSRLDGSRPVAVQASVRDEILTVTVSDRGCWVDSPIATANPSQHQRRGLYLINELANRVDINRSAQGTRITMQFDISEEITPRRRRA